MEDEELAEIHERYKSLAEKARQMIQEGGDDTKISEMTLNRKS